MIQDNKKSPLASSGLMFCKFKRLVVRHLNSDISDTSPSRSRILDKLSLSQGNAKPKDYPYYTQTIPIVVYSYSGY